MKQQKKCSSKSRRHIKNHRNHFKRTYAFNIFMEEGHIWDKVKNKGIDPREVAITSNTTKYYFKCRKCKHSLITSSISAGKGACSYCSAGRLCDDNECNFCFERSYASAPEESLVLCDNRITARNLNKRASSIYLFKCKKCSHIFEQRTDRALKGACSYCSSGNLCDDTNCDFCFKKSFASFDESKLEQWVDSREPRSVSRGVGGYIKFKCKKCNSPFKVKAFFLLSGRWCKYCCAGSGFCQENCSECRKKSMADESVLVWNEKKNGCKASSVKKYISSKWHFTCSKCNHEVFTKMQSDLKGCVYCTKGKLCESLDCKFCHDRSLASFDPIRMKFWSKLNGESKPRDYSRGSTERVYFDCSKCNKPFQVKVIKFTYGAWCNICNLSNRVRFFCLFLDDKGINYCTEYGIINNMRIDMIVKVDSEKFFFIEYDGEQHFHLKDMMAISRQKDTSKAQDLFIKQRKRDMEKNEYIRDNNLLLFRFSYRNTYSVPELFTRMMKEYNSGTNGVVYMDDIDEYWT